MQCCLFIQKLGAISPEVHAEGVTILQEKRGDLFAFHTVHKEDVWQVDAQIQAGGMWQRCVS